MRSGFAQIDITPPIGTHKIGWIKNIIPDAIHDPLFARVAVFENDGRRQAIVQLDTLGVDLEDAHDIRSRVQARFGFPGEAVMVNATHNHGGPAVLGRLGEVKKDAAYTESMIGRCVEAFEQALAAMQDCELGFGSAFEFTVAKNRRLVMRDGTVRTHGTFNDPDALFVEGPIDPEVAVLAARKPDGSLLGCLVNYACHPTHFGGDNVFTGGFPAAMAAALQEQGCPVALYLNGACGNTHTAGAQPGSDIAMDETGRRLAQAVLQAIDAAEFRSDWQLSTVSRHMDLPYREFSDDELTGTVHGAQRFIDPTLYDKVIPEFVASLDGAKSERIEMQAMFFDNVVFVSVPAEYFVEFGLRIKQAAHPARALIVGYANGSIGYIPTREAFSRGGYETTFCPWSKMAYNAGDLMADVAIDLARSRAR